MVNFTVTLPEDLKAEMEKYPEVNWSEVTRKSIQIYVQNRKNPVPQLEFEMKEVHVQYSQSLRRPFVSIRLKATNKLASDVVVDRILYEVDFYRREGRGDERGGFIGQSLEYRSLRPGESETSIIFYPEVDLLRDLTDMMESTFWLSVTLTVFVQGFTNSYIKVVLIKVPIDEWKNEVKSALNLYETHWASKRSLKSKDQ
jgi:hypothetical protein